jgi:molybdate transport repressor ModE-like protein
MTMSYRRAWQLLASINLGFDQPVATASTGGRRGGGTEVTDFGRQLVAGNRRMESKVQSLAAQLREVSQTVMPAAGDCGPIHHDEIKNMAHSWSIGIYRFKAHFGDLSGM